MVFSFILITLPLRAHTYAPLDVIFQSTAEIAPKLFGSTTVTCTQMNITSR